MVQFIHLITSTWYFKEYSNSYLALKINQLNPLRNLILKLTNFKFFKDQEYLLLKYLINWLSSLFMVLHKMIT